MIRVFDVIFALFGLIFLSPLFLIIFIVGWFVNGSPIFKQERIGQKQNPFVMLKFRTMKPGTVSVATHLLDEMSNSAFERFLRRTKLDELPQLLNVLYGEMSLVGPRPCLLNQVELIHLRDQLRIFEAHQLELLRPSLQLHQGLRLCEALYQKI